MAPWRAALDGPQSDLHGVNLARAQRTAARCPKSHGDLTYRPVLEGHLVDELAAFRFLVAICHGVHAVAETQQAVC